MASNGVIWVAGASGFVGQSLLPVLVREGHTVRAVVRRAEVVPAVRSAGAEPIIADLSSPGEWGASLRGVTTVVDVVQSRPSPRLTPSVARRACEERLRVTRALLDAIRTNAPDLRRYVLLAGLDEYRPAPGQWIDEDSPVSTEPKGFARIGGPPLRVLADSASHGGPPLVDIHCGLIYGPGGWFAEYVSRARRRRLPVIGRGDNELALVHVDDVAHAVAGAIAHSSGNRRYNVVDDHPISQVEFVEEVYRGVGRSVHARRIPAWLAGWVAGSVNVETMTASWRVRNNRAREELSWAPQYSDCRVGVPLSIEALEAR